MFTGIVESIGKIIEIQRQGTNLTLWVRSSISPELKVDQSIAHNGVCLTVEELRDDMFRVTAIQETLKKTNLGILRIGDPVNLERCLVVGSRLDGHIVQGHVDTTGTCFKKISKKGSCEFSFTFPKSFGHLIIEKGSIAINGISLTTYKVKKKSFTVGVIPYTYENTNMGTILPSTTVNLEFDLIGKYINRGKEC